MNPRVITRLSLPGIPGLLPSVAWAMAGTASAIALLATSAWLITKSAQSPPILYLTFAIVGVRAFALSRAVFRYLERISSHQAAFVALARLRVSIFDRLAPVAPAGLMGTRRGSLLSTVVSDIDTLQDFPLRVVIPVASSLFVSGVAVAAIGFVSPRAAVTLAVILIATLIIAAVISALVSRSSEHEVAPRRAEFTSAVLENIQRRRVLEAFGAASHADAALENAARACARSEIRGALASGSSPGVVMLLTGVASVAMAILTKDLVAQGEMTGPVFAVLVLVPLAIFEAVAVVPPAVTSWRLVAQSARRIAATIPDSLPPEIPTEDGSGQDLAPFPAPARVSLTLKDFAVRWPGGSPLAHRPLSLSLKPGDRLAVSGPSGSGKTSFAHALVRFLEYQGSYELNGVEATTLSPSTVRSMVTLCEQSPHLFNTSIRHNLSFARPEATTQDLLDVLERVGLAEWVHARGGIDAAVGERGVAVSGGQAQRIALARALLSQAPVIVFDEPTAHVERGLADSLIADLVSVGSQSRDRIVIIMSHTPVPDSLVTARLFFS